MTLVEHDELGGLLRRAAAAHPRCLLNLIVDGLYHYMELRERREFRSDPASQRSEHFLQHGRGWPLLLRAEVSAELAQATQREPAMPPVCLISPD